MLRMDQQIGRPVLIEFWDFLRVNSLRTLPYVTSWHARSAERGLRVIGIHAPGFPPSRARRAAPGAAVLARRGRRAGAAGHRHPRAGLPALARPRGGPGGRRAPG